jgi:hypothetical protein
MRARVAAGGSSDGKELPNDDISAGGTPKMTITSLARKFEIQLDTGHCAPDQARRIESAVSG